MLLPQQKVRQVSEQINYHSIDEIMTSVPSLQSSVGRNTLFRLKQTILTIDELVFPRIVIPLISFLPSPIAYGIAILRADFRSVLTTQNWREVASCIKFVFGNQLSQEQCERHARNFMRVDSCRMVDAMRLFGDGRSFLRLVDIHGLENLTAALERGKGVILASGHVGSPDCIYSTIGALGFPITVVARWSFPIRRGKRRKTRITRIFDCLDRGLSIESHLFEPNIRRRKENLGVAIQAANVLKKGRVLGIMLEPSMKEEDPSRPVEVDFLNGKAKFPIGPITISKITGSPILVMLMHRSANLRKITLEISPPISIDSDQVTSLKRCLTLVERRIRASPYQWFQWDFETIASMFPTKFGKDNWFQLVQRI